MFGPYQDWCEVVNVDSGKKVKAELLDFREKDVLVCSVGRAVKVVLNYNPKTKTYLGCQAGMEFTSNGPDLI